MNRRHSVIALAALTAILAATAISASAGPASARGGGIATRSYVQTNLVSDLPGLAAHTDPNLKNPWGTSVGPGSPIWVSDNHAGVTTLYDGSGNQQPRVVTIPAPPSAGAGAVGAPTGQAFNTFDPTSTDFMISKGGVSGPAFFVFATEDGTIAGWNPNVDNTHAVIAVDNSTATDAAGDVGANYKGLALVSTPSGKFIYATSFRFGRVDVFDNHFNLVNSFTDPTIPAGFAPFGIHNIGGKLYVTFAKQGPREERRRRAARQRLRRRLLAERRLAPASRQPGAARLAVGGDARAVDVRCVRRRHPRRQLRQRPHQRLRPGERKVRGRAQRPGPPPDHDRRALGTAVRARDPRRDAEHHVLHRRPQPRG
jgi:hypothetical protein